MSKHNDIEGVTMNTPDFLPVLGRGAHNSPEEGACIMEYVSLLAGEKWTDRPKCTHPVLARVAQVVNDRLPDSERHRLVPLIGRLFGTAETGTEHERQVLRVRLAVWCARQVLDGVDPRNRDAAVRAIEAAEGWCDGRVLDDEVAAAYAAAAARAAFDASVYTVAAYTAASASTYTAAAAAANGAAAYAANTAKANRLFGFLTGLLDEYDRLTGRTEYRQVTDDDLRTLAAGVGQS